MNIGLKQIIKIALANLCPSFLLRRGTGGTVSAEYCYSAWMRHLIHARKNGLTKIPSRIAEFGPGDSLGIGLCAMLSGCDEYYALDFVEYASLGRNLKIYDELTAMFKSKKLADGSFPHDILTDKLLKKSLDDDRIRRIRNILAGNINSENTAEKIAYIVPWSGYKASLPQLDFILSQAVLEHIDELEPAYAFMAEILAEGGYMSHEIDFRSHNTAAEWNGHWGYSESFWKIVRGRLPYLLNRQPLSVHLNLCGKYKFEILEMQKSTVPPEKMMARSKIKAPFEEMSEDDFMTSSAYIAAVKK